jgi:hypothetical protein
MFKTACNSGVITVWGWPEFLLLGNGSRIASYLLYLRGTTGGVTRNVVYKLILLLTVSGSSEFWLRPELLQKRNSEISYLQTLPRNKILLAKRLRNRTCIFSDAVTALFKLESAEPKKYSQFIKKYTKTGLHLETKKPEVRKMSYCMFFFCFNYWHPVLQQNSFYY